MQGRLRAVVGACACLAVTGVSSGTAVASSHCEPQPVVLASFVSGQDIPESVTTDDSGTVYVSNGNTVQFLPPGGVLATFGTLPLPIAALGVKVGPDGCVYNASSSLSAVPGAFVWRLCSPGSVEVFAELDHGGGPNDLAFDDDGNLFVTDPVLARIYEITPEGDVSVFVEHPLLAGNPANPALVFRAVGVNGIAFDKQQRRLYVSNTDQGTVLRLKVGGTTHTPAVFASDSRLRGADGIAFDRSGELLVAVNAVDSLVALDQHGQLRVLASGGLLDAPSSVAFGATARDKHTLYLTSSAFSRTLGFQPGVPQPALLTLRVSTPGLPLP
jgi:sugar lactone lactonase YvrE